MSPEDQAEFDRQLKGVQGLARHFKATLCGLEWKDGHLRGIYAAKPKRAAPVAEPEEPLFDRVARGIGAEALPMPQGRSVERKPTPKKPPRDKPEQLGLL